jgi:hypothetical protein
VKCADTDPGLYPKKNIIYPGLVPTSLPDLSSVEDMRIECVHVFIEVRQAGGQRFRNKGHVVDFLQNTGHVYDTSTPKGPYNGAKACRLRGWTLATPKLSKSLLASGGGISLQSVLSLAGNYSLMSVQPLL